MALRIKTLLYDEGYTIPGARQAFKSELRSNKDPQLGLAGVAETVDAQHLVAIQKELREIHALLAKPAAPKAGVQQIRAARLSPALLPMPKPKAAPKPFPKPQLIEKKIESSLFDDLFPDV